MGPVRSDEGHLPTPPAGGVDEKTTVVSYIEPFIYTIGAKGKAEY